METQESDRPKELLLWTAQSINSNVLPLLGLFNQLEEQMCHYVKARRVLSLFSWSNSWSESPKSGFFGTFPVLRAGGDLGDGCILQETSQRESPMRLA